MTPAVDECLRITELLTGVLGFLGPLEWLKCAVVSSWWSVAILDDSTKLNTRAHANASMSMSADADADANGVGADAMGKTEHNDSNWISAACSSAGSSANLWREFALTVMRYVSHGDNRSVVEAGAEAGSGGHQEGSRRDAAGGARHPYYKHMCLEGNAEELGQALRPSFAAFDHVKLPLAAIAAAAFVRSRKPR